MTMAEVKPFFCRIAPCEASFTGSPEESVELGWFTPKGAANKYAYCPKHAPEWVEPWRARRKAQAIMRFWSEINALAEDRLEKLERLDHVFRVVGAVPKAWVGEPRSTFLDSDYNVITDFWHDARCEAVRLGGAVAEVWGDSTVTQFDFVFADEPTALNFMESFRIGLKVQAFPDTDHRRFKLHLISSKRFAL